MKPQLERIAPLVLFPAFVAVILLVALYGPASGLPETLLFILTFGSLYAAIAVCERLLPYRREWTRPQGDVATDVAHLFLTGVSSNTLAQAAAYGVATGGAVWLSHRFGAPLWPSRWPLIGQLGLALLIAELGHYTFHRISHERALVWRVHAAHHSAPRLYWLNATRFHPIDLFALIVCQMTPLILLGASPPALLSYALFTGAYGQLQHCNIDVRSGPLRFLFSAPELHRWHHSTDPREGNHNYGAVLSTWDLLLGTFFFPRHRTFTGPVGLSGLPSFPRDYVGQLLSPLRWSAVAQAVEAGVDLGTPTGG